MEFAKKPSPAYVVIGYLVSDNLDFQDLITSTIKVEYLADPFLSDIYSVALNLINSGKKCSLLELSQTLFYGEEKDVKRRLNNARNFFTSIGEITNNSASETTIRTHCLSFLVSCTNCTTSGYELENVIRTLIQDYKEVKIQELFSKYKNDLSHNPSDQALSDKFVQDFQAIENIGIGQTWQIYQLDLRVLKNQPPTTPLIMRGETGLIYRDDVHMISGPAGSMKSLFSIYFAASALNDGLKAETTLGLYAGAKGLKVGYIDTELGESTIQRRLSIFENLCGSKLYDKDRFYYLSMSRVNKTERKNQTFNFIRKSDCDLIIVDGIRDLCVDFNDSKEAAELADEFKRLAGNLHKAIIVTSHTSKGTDFSRGHLGSQFNDLVAFEITLKPDTSLRQSGQSRVNITYNKARHGMPDPFVVEFDKERNCLILAELLIDMSELSRSQRAALDIFKKYLTPDTPYRFSEIVSILANHGIGRETVKKYLSQAKGYTLAYIDGKYVLRSEKSESLLDVDSDDLPY